MQNVIENPDMQTAHDMLNNINMRETNTIPLSSLELTFLLPQIQNKLQCYCLKTGKRLDDIAFSKIENLITLHGVDRAITVLEKLQQSVSPEWILTDSQALIALAEKQPVEYFIYALSSLLRKTEDKEENTMQLLYEFHEKIEANKILKTINWQQIAICAELVRKILSANRPVAIQEMIETFTLKEICKNEENVFKFQLVLQECWKQIKNGYYDNNIINARNRKRKELFAKQRKLTIQSELEKEINESIDFSGIEHLEYKTPQQIASSMGKASLEAKKVAERQKAKKLLYKQIEQNPNLAALTNLSNLNKANKKINLDKIKPVQFTGLKIGGK